MENRILQPNRIKQARVSRGFSMAELADRLEISRQAISQYELGKIEPSKAVLNLLSRSLRYPVDFFYSPVNGSQTAQSAVFFRSAKTTTVKNYNAAKEKINISNDIHGFFCRYIDFPAPNLPEFDYTEDLDLEEIEVFASELRSFWKLDRGPIGNLTSILERNGVLFSRMSLNLSKIDGFSNWHDGTPHIFICTDKDSNSRLRFSAAHELCHILLHIDNYAQENLANKDISEKLENEANLFAGAFLLPKEEFSKDIYSTSIEHFIQLKLKWKVSISAMISRCKVLGLLTPNQLKYLNDQMTFNRYWRNEPFDKTMPLEKPVAYKQAIELLLGENILTKYDIINELSLYPQEIEEYCFLEKGTLSEDNEFPNNVIKLKV